MAGITTIRNFKFPPMPQRDNWNFSDKQKMFLDSTLFDFLEPWVMYRSLVLGDMMTPFQARKLCKEFMESIDAKEYINMRITDIDKVLFGVTHTGLGGNKQPVDRTFELPENWIEITKSEAWRKLQESGFSGGEEWRIFLTMAMKQVESNTDVELPMRYLAETCSSCRYKIFCENPENAKDMCAMCVYKAKALESGAVKTELGYREQFTLQIQKPKENEIQGKSDGLSGEDGNQ